MMPLHVSTNVPWIVGASRRAAIGALLFVATPWTTAGLAAQARVASDTQRVVFVCEHGTVKSVVAAAHFNRLAKANGLRAVAVSRGTAPDSELPALIRDGLRADGAAPWRDRPTPFRASDVAGASLIVSFDQPVDSMVRLVAHRALVRHWDGTPSVMRDYATGRDSIVARVRALVAELRATQSPSTRAAKQP